MVVAGFPTLELQALTGLLGIKEHMDADPEWLEKSPYGSDIRAALTTLFEPKIETVVLREGQKVEGHMKRGRKAKAGELSDEQAQIIEEEAGALLKELKDLKPPTGSKFDHDTKIQIIKAKTSLIEKVVNIQERAFNVRKVANFQKVVIDILAELVDPDKINEFQNRLEKYL